MVRGQLLCFEKCVHLTQNPVKAENSSVMKVPERFWAVFDIFDFVGQGH